MDRSTETLAFAGLSFATALLSIGIYELTGTWPSEFGHWGGVLFVLVGGAIAGSYVLARLDVESETIQS